MRYHLRLQFVAAFVMMTAAGAAVACNPAEPRCQTLHTLLDALGYPERIETFQSHCERTAQLAIETHITADAGGSAQTPGEERREEARRKALEAFVEQRCGGMPFRFVIRDLYRRAWDAELPGSALDAALGKSALDPSDMAAHMTAVRQRVAQTLDPLVVAMNGAASSRLERRLKQIQEGQIDDAPGPTSCRDDAEVAMAPADAEPEQDEAKSRARQVVANALRSTGDAALDPVIQRARSR